MLQNPLPDENQKNRSLFLIGVPAVFLLTLILFLFLEARFSDLSLRDLGVQFKNSLYLPHHNSFKAGQIGQVNVMTLFYVFLLAALLTTMTYCYFIRLTTNKRIFLWESVTTAGIMGFLMLAGVQQIHRFEYFKFEQKKFADKTTEEKLIIVFGKKYHFSSICRKLLPGQHQGRLVTDLDTSKELYILARRILSYHLYPTVSLGFRKYVPEDCLILFHKKNPLEHIPEDYRILFASLDNRYILARRVPPP